MKSPSKEKKIQPKPIKKVGTKQLQEALRKNLSRRKQADDKHC